MEVMLLVACKAGDTARVKRLLDRDANLRFHARDVSYERTALHWASFNGYAPIVKLLLEYACSGGGRRASKILNAKDKQNLTPLDLATYCGFKETVRLLLDSGASVEGSRGRHRPLHTACVSGNLRIVNMLLEKSAQVNARTESGFTPLHLASYHGHSDVIYLLLVHNADLGVKYSNGCTALHWASKKGHLEAARALVSAGSSVKSTDKLGMTPLHCASLDGHIDLVRYFVLDMGVNPHVLNNEGNTPRDLASFDEHFDVVEFLDVVASDVSAAKTDISKPQDSGMEPEQCGRRLSLLKRGLHSCGPNSKLLLHASIAGDAVLVRRLFVDRSGCFRRIRLDARDSKYGRTPLHWASLKGHVSIVGLILDCVRRISCSLYTGDKDEIDFLNDNDFIGLTPLLLASSEMHLKVIHLLLEHGANVEGNTTKGQTPLLAACQRGNLPVAKLLLERGADANAYSHDEESAFFGYSALHLACHFGHMEVVHVLLAYGADVSEKSKKGGYTALHRACQMGHLEIAQYLVDMGADVNQRNAFGSTPLHSACDGGNIELVRYLVEDKCANPRASNRKGKKPIDRARRRNHQIVVDFLELWCIKPKAFHAHAQTSILAT